MDKVLLLLVVALVIVIIVRGPKTLPQIGQMLGRGVKEARKEANEIKTDMRKDDAAPAPVATVSGPVPAPVAPVPPVVPVAPPPPPATPGPGPSAPA